MGIRPNRKMQRPEARLRPLGAILAGGSGRRIGGAKPAVRLAGRPLITYPLEAMRLALEEVVVLAKVDSGVPSLAGVRVCMEPSEPRHPLAGIVHAIELAAPRPALVCAADLPFVTTAVVRDLAACDPAPASAVIACHDGRAQPLLGCYWPGALAVLGPALCESGITMAEVIARLRPRLHDVEDPDVLLNVNTPDDLLLAAAKLDRVGARAQRGAPRPSRT